MAAAFAAFSTYLSMLAHHHSLARLFAFELVSFAFWAAVVPAIAGLTRRFRLLPFRFASVVVHFAAGALLGLLHVAWKISTMIVMRPYDAMTITSFHEPFTEVLRGKLAVEMLTYWAIVAAAHAFSLYAGSRERALHAARLERELARARLDALALQLQPHFLFNALHTVAGLVRGGEAQGAITTIATLSELLRYSLDSSSAPEVTLGDELEMVRKYLAIQELRFGERLAVRLDVTPETLAARVPRLLLQPLVENAVRHGAATIAGPAWLELAAQRRDGRLAISIRNSTREAAPSTQASHGIGLANTRARLEQLHGRGFTLQTRRLADRFELELELPRATAAAAGAEAGS